MLLLASLFFGLGQWQYGRAAQSRALAASFAANAGEAVRTAIPSRDDRYGRYRLRGRYLPERQVLLDNAVESGSVGYYVLTPFEVDSEHALVLVNRGFVAAGPDRNVLPDVAVGGSERAVTGHVDVLPRPGVRLGEPTAAGAATAPVTVMSYPTAARLAAHFGRPVHDYQLRLAASEPEGFVRDWRAAGILPERHLAYAGQWWALAVAAAATGAVLAWRARGKRDAS